MLDTVTFSMSYLPAFKDVSVSEIKYENISVTKSNNECVSYLILCHFETQIFDTFVYNSIFLLRCIHAKSVGM